MNEIEFRVLETLAKEIGNPMSISTLTKKIRDNYGTGDYKNIHNTVKNLAGKDIIKLEKNGNSTITSLNFENHLLVDLLTEMELVKKIQFLEKRPELQMVLSELNVHIKEFGELEFLLLSSPERNAKLNRIELLLVLRHGKMQKEAEITGLVDRLKKRHNVTIECLLLEDAVFLDYLASQESNTAKQVFKDRLILFGAQTFWIELKEAMLHGLNIKGRDIARPAEISEREHVYNLGRLGHTEFGNKLKDVESLGIEFLVTSILLREDIRHVEAVPVILARNDEKINYGLLFFLSIKYDTIERLYGILNATNAVKPMEGLEKAIKEMNRRKIKGVKVDMDEVEEKLRLYDAIK